MVERGRVVGGACVHHGQLARSVGRVEGEALDLRVCHDAAQMDAPRLVPRMRVLGPGTRGVDGVVALRRIRRDGAHLQLEQQIDALVAHAAAELVMEEGPRALIAGRARGPIGGQQRRAGVEKARVLGAPGIAQPKAGQEPLALRIDVALDDLGEVVDVGVRVDGAEHLPGSHAEAGVLAHHRLARRSVAEHPRAEVARGSAGEGASRREQEIEQPSIEVIRPLGRQHAQRGAAVVPGRVVLLHTVGEADDQRQHPPGLEEGVSRRAGHRRHRQAARHRRRSGVEHALLAGPRHRPEPADDLGGQRAEFVVHRSEARIAVDGGHFQGEVVPNQPGLVFSVRTSRPVQRNRRRARPGARCVSRSSPP